MACLNIWSVRSVPRRLLLDGWSPMYFIIQLYEETASFEASSLQFDSSFSLLPLFPPPVQFLQKR